MRGAPRGSVLKVLSFNGFINNVSIFTEKSKLFRFADDNIFWEYGQDLSKILGNLKHDCRSYQNVLKWTLNKLIEVNFNLWYLKRIIEIQLNQKQIQQKLKKWMSLASTHLTFHQVVQPNKCL